MTAKGHVLLATAVASIPVKLGYVEVITPFMIAVVIGSLLPDIDHSGSFMGRRVALLSLPLSFLMRHRGPTHWLIAPVLLVTASLALIENALLVMTAFGVAFGWLMHSVGDMLTKGGIEGFFFPFFRERKAVLLPRRLRFYTGSMVEYLLILTFLLINITVWGGMAWELS